MEKQEYSQLELFNKTSDEVNSAQRLPGILVNYIRTYERFVLMLIGIVISGVICFCIGVEKGKHIALARINSNLDLAEGQSAMPQKGGTEAGVSGQGAPLEPKEPRTAPAIAATDTQLAGISTTIAGAKGNINDAAQIPRAMAQGYTIQIASYLGKTAAQREMDVLKKQGLMPVVKSSGKYTVLCVGNFADMSTAKSLLTQLKRKYKDCYIRRL